MNKMNLFNTAFLGSLLTGVIGTILKIMHLPGGYFFLILTIILTVSFAIIALYEIYNSNSITVNEKIMWTVGFVLFSTLSGFLYFIFGRPRITRSYKVLIHGNHN